MVDISARSVVERLVEVAVDVCRLALNWMYSGWASLSWVMIASLFWSRGWFVGGGGLEIDLAGRSGISIWAAMSPFLARE